MLGLFACKKDDPCENITCLNGGTCANGECSCPTGYTGPDCSQLLIPKSIKIRDIKVTKFPATRPNGNSWDFTNGADLYVALGQGTSILTTNRNSTVFDAISSPIEWQNPPSFIMFSGGDPDFCILLYDADEFGDDELIDGVCYTFFSSSSTSFPETINLSYTGGSVDFTLTLEYIF